MRDDFIESTKRRIEYLELMIKDDKKLLEKIPVRIKEKEIEIESLQQLLKDLEK